uniref:AlNc14C14G1602 protein n=1 Tax=Albugo laibachii Nc14 TaxID=890382 RepID=F0W3T7_9STRA|nr:AlNc14C14G1602 [Albugo laibachii Nc14]|eukprot:CCA15685.1 AlNc14C14G1602 [Albugo laibachii Nc14]
MIIKKKVLYYVDRLDEILSRFEEDGQETLERELETDHRQWRCPCCDAVGTESLVIGNMHNYLQLLASYGNLGWRAQLLVQF